MAASDVDPSRQASPLGSDPRPTAVARFLVGLGADVRVAVRALTRRPAFAATAIVTLTLGIGATTAIFTVVNGVLVRPLPYRDPGQLITIYSVFPRWRGKPVVGAIWNTLLTPFPDYLRYRAAQHTLTDVAAFNIEPRSLTRGDETTQIMVGEGTANLTSLLGIPMEHGRWFLPGEDGPGAPPLAVLSHDLWVERFGGDERVMGTAISIGETAFTVVGVLPPDFSLTSTRADTRAVERPDVWVPVGTDKRVFQAGNYAMDLIGRLRPGVTITAALAEAEPILRGDTPPTRRTARIVPRAEVEVGAVRRPLLLLFGAVAVLLAITCGNVAALFLGECALREPELRTRAVLGAGRWRLIRLLLTEAGVIAGIAAAAGTLLAWWGTRVMLALAPSRIPHAAVVRVDGLVLAFTLGIAVLVALIAGVAPALLFVRGPSETNPLVGGRIARGRSRLQLTAIGLQAAGSVVLLAGTGLLARSLINQRGVTLGFDAGRALVMRIELPRSRTRTDTDARLLDDNVQRALEAVPGTIRVTASSAPPLEGHTNGQAVRPVPVSDSAQPPVDVERAVVFPNYFSALHIPVLVGRAFTSGDVPEGPPVAVVSETMARQLWPGESAIGKQFKHPNGVTTVIGVVADVRNASLDRAPDALFYLPESQASTTLSYIIQTAGDPGASATAARHAVWSAVPGATISEIATMHTLIDEASAPARYRALLGTIFAVLALTLTAVGVAGLTGRGVSSRMRELCIRMALGAPTRSTVALAIGRAVGAAALGASIGLVLAPLTSRWLADYLYEVRPGDATTYALTAVLMAGVCVAAAWVAVTPVRRADLAQVLRDP